MKLLALSLITALSAGAAFTTVPAAPTDPGMPAASWAPRDTADSLWRAGRIAISEEAWEEAAEAFREIVARHPRSAYAGDALYWEAFALQRTGRQSNLRRAVAALEKQKADYATAQTYTSGEASALLTRVKGRLARSGDHAAAVDVADMAEAIAEVTTVATTEALRAASDAMVQVGPELRRGLEEARVDLERARISMGRDRGRDRDQVPPGCEDAVDDERIEALNAMLQMNSEQALPILRKVLQRRDKCSELLRRKAVFLVSQQRGDEAADILLEVAKSDPDPQTREDAVFWLSQTNSERAAEVLEQILLKESPDAALQKKAVFSLSQSRSERSQRVLRDFVRRRDVDPEVRSEAIFWLGQSNGEENAAVLREIFPTLEDEEAQEKLLFALSQGRSAENSRFLLARAKDKSLDADLRRTALFWAGQNRGVAVADLGEIYDSAGDDTELREQVIFTLSQRRDPDGVGQLIAIARKEQDRELRKKAIFWLSQSRDPRAAKFLEELVSK